MDFTRAARALAAWALLVATSTSLSAAVEKERHSLKSRHRPGELARVEVALQVGGDLKLVSGAKPKTLPLSVVANLKYDEKCLQVNRTDDPVRSVRFYDEARAVIKVDKGGEKPSLGESHRLIAVEKPEKSAALLFCPSAALAREELDLIDVPANTLVIDQLLPSEKVALGDSWKLADQTLADLLSLDAVSWTDVEAMLAQVADGVADVAAAGSVSGAVGGVSTEIELKIKFKFDLKLKRITYLAMLVKEKRSVGHVGPGLDTVAKLIMTIAPVSASDKLTAAALEQVSAKVTPGAAELSYASKGGRFQFHYDRRWYLTSDDPKLAVWRLLDKGELVAQCNMSALSDKKKPLALAEFQREVQESLGKNFGQFIKASQGTNDAGYSVLRVVVHGSVSKLPIEWIYYLVQDEKGRGVSLAFTLEQDLEDRFAEADRTLVGRLRLITAPPNAAPQATTAARPTKAE